ncbi:hypothetical protein KR044_000963 [Drosophila immigrans]|nr:hypothetical protein KR044_000963 [Drosophila immigrans]
MAHVSFTNLKCAFKNASIGEFELCEIKAVNRTHKYINIHTKLHILPINYATTSLRLMRYDHGYKPFFVNITFDACKYLKNQGNPFVNVFFNIFKGFSNLNHTCPYNHDIILNKFWTGNHDDSMAKYLPIRNGQYALHINFSQSKVDICTVVLYMLINN